MQPNTLVTNAVRYYWVLESILWLGFTVKSGTISKILIMRILKVLYHDNCMSMRWITFPPQMNSARYLVLAKYHLQYGCFDDYVTIMPIKYVLRFIFLHLCCKQQVLAWFFTRNCWGLGTCTFSFRQLYFQLLSLDINLTNTFNFCCWQIDYNRTALSILSSYLVPAFKK